MRLKRIQRDFRVTELLRDEQALLGDGPYMMYRVTKIGLTTFEAADRLAEEAGVDREAVAYAGLKDKDGVTGQFMTVLGGRPVNVKEEGLAIFRVGPAVRSISSEDSAGNAFEIFVRDLTGDDMRRIRVNLEQVKRLGLPNYFDDQRFGCLRHGQGFIVRHLLAGDAESALRAVLAAPSRYGSEKIEAYKEGIAKRWGDWDALAAFTRGARGASAFDHLRAFPRDFPGALERGVASRERTIHLFAYQSHLWNRALALRVQQAVRGPDLAFLPGDAGALAVWRAIEPAALAELEALELPLLGKGAELSAEARRLYDAVLAAEGFTVNDFLALDRSGFRPLAEPRQVVIRPEFLRAAPAEPDDMFRLKHKMRLRFSLGRGQYATMTCKRLLMPTENSARPPRLWISRHELAWPDAIGHVASEMLERRLAPRPPRAPRPYDGPQRSFDGPPRPFRPHGHDERRDSRRSPWR